MSMWRPLHKEIPKIEEPSYLQPLDVCDVWKGLNLKHAKELSFWNRCFISSIQECLGEFVTGKFRGDPEWTSAFQLGEFVNRELTRAAVPINVDNLASKMLQSSYQENLGRSFLRWAHYDQRVAVRLFLSTQQCWLNNEQATLMAEFSSTWTSQHLEISARILWHPPAVSFCETSLKPTYMEPFLSQPPLQDRTLLNHQWLMDYSSFTWRQVVVTTVTKNFSDGVCFQRILRVRLDLYKLYEIQMKAGLIAGELGCDHRYNNRFCSEEDYLDYPTSDGEVPGRIPSSPASWSLQPEKVQPPTLDIDLACEYIGETGNSPHLIQSGTYTDQTAVEDSMHFNQTGNWNRQMAFDHRVDTPVHESDPREKDLSPCSKVALAAVQLTMKASENLKAAVQLQEQVCNDLQEGTAGSPEKATEIQLSPGIESCKPVKNGLGSKRKKKKRNKRGQSLPTPPSKSVSGTSTAQHDFATRQYLADMEQARIRDNYDQFCAARGVDNGVREDIGDLLEFQDMSDVSPAESPSDYGTAQSSEASSRDDGDKRRDEASQSEDRPKPRDTYITISEDSEPLVEYARTSHQKPQHAPLERLALGEISHNPQAPALIRFDSKPRLKRAFPLSAYESQQMPQHPQPPETPRPLPSKGLPPRWPPSNLTLPLPVMGIGSDGSETLTPTGYGKPSAITKLFQETARDGIAFNEFMGNSRPMLNVRGGGDISPSQIGNSLHETARQPPRRSGPTSRYYTVQADHGQRPQRARIPSFNHGSSHNGIGDLSQIEGMLNRLNDSIASRGSAPRLHLNTNPITPLRRSISPEPSSPHSPGDCQQSPLKRAKLIEDHLRALASSPPTPPPHLQSIYDPMSAPKPYHTYDCELRDPGTNGAAGIGMKAVSAPPTESKTLRRVAESRGTGLLGHCRPQHDGATTWAAYEARKQHTGTEDNQTERDGEEADSPGPSPRHWKGKAVPFVELVKWFTRARAAEGVRDHERAHSESRIEHSHINNETFEAGIEELTFEEMGQTAENEEEMPESASKRGVLCDRGHGTEMDGSGCLGTDDFWSKE